MMMNITKTERELLELVLSGFNNQDISEHRGVSPTTVKGQISWMFTKFKVKNRTELAEVAKEIIGKDEIS